MATHRPMRSCRLEDALYLKIKYIADQERRSFNNLLEVILKDYVEQFEEKNGVIAVDSNALYE